MVRPRAPPPPVVFSSFWRGNDGRVTKAGTRVLSGVGVGCRWSWVPSKEIMTRSWFLAIGLRTCATAIGTSASSIVPEAIRGSVDQGLLPLHLRRRESARTLHVLVIATFVRIMEKTSTLLAPANRWRAACSSAHGPATVDVECARNKKNARSPVPRLGCWKSNPTRGGNQGRRFACWWWRSNLGERTSEIKHGSSRSIGSSRDSRGCFETAPTTPVFFTPWNATANSTYARKGDWEHATMGTITGAAGGLVGSDTCLPANRSKTCR